MKLKFTKGQFGYQSLQDDFDIDINDFTVLTGINGSGKTHLLKGIYESKVRLFDEHNNEIENLPESHVQKCRFLSGLDLVLPEAMPATKQQMFSKLEAIYNQYEFWAHANRTNEYQILIENYIPDINQREAIQELALKIGKPIIDLTKEDFDSGYPIHSLVQRNDIFQHNISEIFKAYFDKQQRNRYNRWKKIEYPDEHIQCLSDEDFITTVGEPPWIIMNSLLKNASLDYTITYPQPNSNDDFPFQAKLFNNISSSEVGFNDLSSGEKVLISLVIGLYNVNYSSTLPKILLLDELDAPLHPSMCKQLLQTIKKTFVEEKGIKVIMTTHSSSTVAFAEEEQIYVMNKTTPRIQKVSKDAALSILTAGVPSFSINYENRRQVFVEDKNDVEFYEKIYTKLKSKLIQDVSLTFISAGETRVDKNGQPITGCDQVKNIVEVLSTSGNRFIRGIVDWDNSNTETESLKVLGLNSRYSIENYLLDPLLITALLIREKIVPIMEVGVTENTIDHFKNYEQEVLQGIADFCINKIKSNTFTMDDKDLLIEVEYVNKTKLKIPKWYLYAQGHRLEQAVKEAFPELNRYRGENGLKSEILKKVIDDIPEFIPNDILNTMRELQN